MLRLIDMRAHRYNTAYARRVCFTRPRRWRMHDRVLGAPQEICGPAQSIQHPASHNAGAIRVRVNVDLDGCIHADHSQAADDLGRVGHLLGP